VTVSAQTPINRSAGNGVTTVFPYTFKIIAAADIEVTVDDVVKTLNVDYTVSGAGLDAGGNVTMTTAPASGTTVVRRRNMAIVRTTDYQDQGSLPASTLDDDVDAVVLMVQQLDERLDRTFSLPASSSADSTMPEPTAGYVIGWDALGERLTNLPAAVGTSLIDLAASTGSTLIGFIQSGTGAVASTAQNKMREFLSVFDFMTAVQIADVRAGTFTQDVTTAMNVAATVAGVAKKGLRVPAGGYKMTAPWVVPPEVYVLGESPGMETAYDPGGTLLFGAVIFKAHTGHGITKTGSYAYHAGAPIENISISSNRTTYPAGAGIVLDKVSTCHLIRCNTFSMGGDSYIIGVTAGDVTGHNYTFNCYSNNPVGVHYRIRQKSDQQTWFWLVAVTWGTPPLVW
jgi:hypothetical protein